MWSPLNARKHTGIAFASLLSALMQDFLRIWAYDPSLLVTGLRADRTRITLVLQAN